MNLLLPFTIPLSLYGHQSYSLEGYILIPYIKIQAEGSAMKQT